MRKLSPSGKIALASVAVIAAVLGTTALVQSASAKGRPGGGPPLLCGPTFQWSCSGVGGPDRLFIGTVCEKDDFEQESGLTCVPI